MVPIVARAAWGARPWRGQPTRVDPSRRAEVVIHHHGDTGPRGSGAAMCREVEAIHMDERGWNGIGYNFLVDNADGRAYEGRGWDLQGAHCKGHNVIGLGIYIGVGGNQTPSTAALRTVRALYDEARQRTGVRLRKTWHSALYATECPGPALIAWVRAGMPADGTPTAQEDTVLSDDEIAQIQAAAREGVWGARWPTNDPERPYEYAADRLVWASRSSAMAAPMQTVLDQLAALRADLQRGTPIVLSQPQIDAIATAVAARVPAGPGGTADAQVIARAVVAELTARLAS